MKASLRSCSAISLFDRSVLLRFALILGAGMSMLLGARVERAVDAALG